MENTDSSFQDKENSLISYIRCTYDIKDTNETQIMNYRSETYVNDEIEKKVKILRDGNKEKLAFKKKFDKLGLNTVEFIIEGKLTSISYLFYKCSTLKEVEFINFETTQVTKMRAMFVDCNGLECLDLTCFDVSKVTDMAFMFN